MHARACVVALSSDACSSSENSSSKLSGNESEIHFALEAIALGGGGQKKKKKALMLLGCERCVVRIRAVRIAFSTARSGVLT